MKKKIKIYALTAAAGLSAISVIIIKVFEAYYDDFGKGVLWGLAIMFLLMSLVFFATKAERGKIIKYVFLVIGGVLLIICVFAFIENMKTSIRILMIAAGLIVCFVFYGKSVQLEKMDITEKIDNKIEESETQPKDERQQ